MLRIGWLAAQGFTATEIADDSRINAMARDVRFALDRSGLPPCRAESDARVLAVEVRRRHFHELDRAAGARGVDHATLASTILGFVLNDRLVAAVIDDGRG
jgi:hypothetical protein